MLCMLLQFLLLLNGKICLLVGLHKSAASELHFCFGNRTLVIIDDCRLFHFSIFYIFRLTITVLTTLLCFVTWLVVWSYGLWQLESKYFDKIKFGFMNRF